LLVARGSGSAALCWHRRAALDLRALPSPACAVTWVRQDRGVPLLRASALVDAPARTVAAALLDGELLAASAARVGARVDLPHDLLAPGDELRCTALGAHAVLRVVRADQTGMAATLVSGPLRELELRTELTATDGGTLLLDSVRWTLPGGVLGRVADVVVGRGLALRVLAARADAVRDRVRRLGGARVVVGAAIVRGGRLLTQQRGYPADVAGRWELPGGRVEPGETDAAAVARECHEELGVPVRAGHPIGPDLPLPGDHLLRVYAATLTDDTEPVAREHRALRWVTAAELADLDWLPADRVLVPALRDLLA
jgi:8-oxo-dGTP diphosphatase